MVGKLNIENTGKYNILKLIKQCTEKIKQCTEKH